MSMCYREGGLELCSLGNRAKEIKVDQFNHFFTMNPLQQYKPFVFLGICAETPGRHGGQSWGNGAVGRGPHHRSFDRRPTGPK
jgi:hypothetical protein